MLARVVANHIPAYLVGGEFDIFQNGEPVNYAELQNAWAGRSTTAPMLPGQRTTGRYQLIDGPWEHLNGSSVNVDPLELEWFDTWLKGEQTGMARTPTPLHYYDLGSGEVRRDLDVSVLRSHPDPPVLRRRRDADGPSAPAGGGTSSSPIPGLPVPLAARPHRRHDRVEPERSALRPADRPVVDGRHLGPGGFSRIPGPVRHRRPARPDRAMGHSYTSAPFAHATTLAGPMTATVYASATTPRPSSSPSWRTSRRAAPPIRSPRARCSARCARWTRAGPGLPVG